MDIVNLIMTTVLKKLFVLVALPLSIILSGCNSEGAFSSPKTVIDITIAPSSITVLEGLTQQLTATARYDDGSEGDVTNSVQWQIVGDPTVAEITASGLLKGIAAGATELSANIDGIFSNTLNVSICNLAGTCLDTFDVGSGKLFTNSPSKSYLDSIGGSATNSVFSENGTFGPTGDFYRFDWNNANSLCTTYNAQNLAGRTNWRLATISELQLELYNTTGNMFNVRGWPANFRYWSSTPGTSSGYRVWGLYGGNLSDNVASTFEGYVSCVSEP
jgi:hypothetical protein